MKEAKTTNNTGNTDSERCILYNSIVQYCFQGGGGGGEVFHIVGTIGTTRKESLFDPRIPSVRKGS